MIRTCYNPLNTFGIAVLLSIAYTGCSNDTTSPDTSPGGDGSPRVPARTGELIASVNVAGDPGTGPQQYLIEVDGNGFWVLPNDTLSRWLREGSHSVWLRDPPWPLFDSYTLDENWDPILTPGWCSFASTNYYEVMVKSDEPQTVSFSIFCPQLVGTGRVVIALNDNPLTALGPGSVTLTRLYPTTPSPLSIDVPLAATTEVEIPVGVYGVDVRTDYDCVTVGYSSELSGRDVSDQPFIRVSPGNATDPVKLRLWCMSPIVP